MAAANRFDANSKMVVVFSSTDLVPISFPLDGDGVARISSVRLSLRFQINEKNMLIDEEVCDVLM